MAKTIEQGFNEFHTKLTPSGVESAESKSHRESIRECLVSNMGMTNLFRTGSTGNGTGVSGYSDTDYFAVIPTANLKSNSTYSLQKVEEVLKTKFPLTNIYIDTPSVVCKFSGTAVSKTEIVPADRNRLLYGYWVYDIPDNIGGWIQASPLIHNNYVTSINDRLGGKLKPLIRFIKAWKYYNNVPISSFYLELRIAKTCYSKTSITYDYDIKSIIKYLVDNNLPDIIDPTGISGLISPCKTDTKKTDAISKLNTALIRADYARSAKLKDHTKSAFDWWDKFYNGKFPSYN